MGHPPFDPSPSPPTESEAELTPLSEPPMATGAEGAEPESRPVERWLGGGRPAGLPPAVVRAVDRVLDALDAAADAVRAAANRISW